MEDIVIILDDDFSSYLSDIRENEDKRIANELIRISNEELRNQYFEQLLKDKKSYYKQFYKLYKTTTVSENTFALPDEYTEACMVDIYVNGLYLNTTEYEIVNKDVVLTKTLDVIGTVIEIVVTKAIGITEEDYDNLRGYSAYEVAVLNGFDGTEEEWLASLKGIGGVYNKRVTYYTSTTASQTTFDMPEYYQNGCFKDIYVNGMKLLDSEYSIKKMASGYVLILANALDVIGTPVEIDVVESEAYEENSGYLAYDIDYLKNYYLKSETYTKDEVNNLLGNKANSSDVTAEIETATADMATKTYVDEAIASAISDTLGGAY